jgi:hypothetical protein
MNRYAFPSYLALGLSCFTLACAGDDSTADATSFGTRRTSAPLRSATTE